jgi:hypothetical protein
VRALVNCRVCELAIVLLLVLVTFCKWSINAIISPNLVYSQIETHDSIKSIVLGSVHNISLPFVSEFHSSFFLGTSANLCGSC